MTCAWRERGPNAAKRTGEMSAEMAVLLGNPDVVIALGELLMAAVILGSVLDRGYRDLLSWVVAVGVFVLIQTVVALEAVDQVELFRPVLAFSILTALTYIFGLALGWAFVRVVKILYWKKQTRAELQRLDQLSQRNQPKERD